MSDFIDCYDVVSLALEDAEETFLNKAVRDENKVNILGKYCRILDSISEENDGKSFLSFVNKETHTVNIGLECESITLDSIEEPYYILVKRAISMSFSISKRGNLITYFEFPSIWEERE